MSIKYENPVLLKYILNLDTDNRNIFYKKISRISKGRIHQFMQKLFAKCSVRIQRISDKQLKTLQSISYRKEVMDKKKSNTKEHNLNVKTNKGESSRKIAERSTTNTDSIHNVKDNSSRCKNIDEKNTRISESVPLNSKNKRKSIDNENKSSKRLKTIDLFGDAKDELFEKPGASSSSHSNTTKIVDKIQDKPISKNKTNIKQRSKSIDSRIHLEEKPKQDNRKKLDKEKTEVKLKSNNKTNLKQRSKSIDSRTYLEEKPKQDNRKKIDKEKTEDKLKLNNKTNLKQRSKSIDSRTYLEENPKQDNRKKIDKEKTEDKLISNTKKNSRHRSKSIDSRSHLEEISKQDNQKKLDKKKTEDKHISNTNKNSRLRSKSIDSRSYLEEISKQDNLKKLDKEKTEAKHISNTNKNSRLRSKSIDSRSYLEEISKQDNLKKLDKEKTEAKHISNTNKNSRLRSKSIDSRSYLEEISKQDNLKKLDKEKTEAKHISNTNKNSRLRSKSIDSRSYLEEISKQDNLKKLDKEKTEAKHISNTNKNSRLRSKSIDSRSYLEEKTKEDNKKYEEKNNGKPTRLHSKEKSKSTSDETKIDNRTDTKRSRSHLKEKSCVSKSHKKVSLENDNNQMKFTSSERKSVPSTSSKNQSDIAVKSLSLHHKSSKSTSKKHTKEINDNKSVKKRRHSTNNETNTNDNEWRVSLIDDINKAPNRISTRRSTTSGYDKEIENKQRLRMRFYRSKSVDHIPDDPRLTSINKTVVLKKIYRRKSFHCGEELNNIPDTSNVKPKTIVVPTFENEIDSSQAKETNTIKIEEILPPVTINSNNNYISVDELLKRQRLMIVQPPKQALDFLTPLAATNQEDTTSSFTNPDEPIPELTSSISIPDNKVNHKTINNKRRQSMYSTEVNVSADIKRRRNSANDISNRNNHGNIEQIVPNHIKSPEVNSENRLTNNRTRSTKSSDTNSAIKVMVDKELPKISMPVKINRAKLEKKGTICVNKTKAISNKSAINKSKLSLSMPLLDNSDANTKKVKRKKPKSDDLPINTSSSNKVSVIIENSTCHTKTNKVDNKNDNLQPSTTGIIGGNKSFLILMKEVIDQVSNDLDKLPIISLSSTEAAQYIKHNFLSLWNIHIKCRSHCNEVLRQPCKQQEEYNLTVDYYTRLRVIQFRELYNRLRTVQALKFNINDFYNCLVKTVAQKQYKQPDALVTEHIGKFITYILRVTTLFFPKTKGKFSLYNHIYNSEKFKVYTDNLKALETDISTVVSGVTEKSNNYNIPKIINNTPEVKLPILRVVPSQKLLSPVSATVIQSPNQQINNTPEVKLPNIRVVPSQKLLSPVSATVIQSPNQQINNTPEVKLPNIRVVPSQKLLSPVTATVVQSPNQQINNTPEVKLPNIRVVPSQKLLSPVSATVIQSPNQQTNPVIPSTEALNSISTKQSENSDLDLLRNINQMQSYLTMKNNNIPVISNDRITVRRTSENSYHINIGESSNTNIQQHIQKPTNEHSNISKERVQILENRILQLPHTDNQNNQPAQTTDYPNHEQCNTTDVNTQNNSVSQNTQNVSLAYSKCAQSNINNTGTHVHMHNNFVAQNAAEVNRQNNLLLQNNAFGNNNTPVTNNVQMQNPYPTSAQSNINNTGTDVHMQSNIVAQNAAEVNRQNNLLLQNNAFGNNNTPVTNNVQMQYPYPTFAQTYINKNQITPETIEINQDNLLLQNNASNQMQNVTMIPSSQNISLPYPKSTQTNINKNQNLPGTVEIRRQDNLLLQNNAVNNNTPVINNFQMPNDSLLYPKSINTYFNKNKILPGTVEHDNLLLQYNATNNNTQVRNIIQTQNDTVRCSAQNNSLPYSKSPQTNINNNQILPETVQSSNRQVQNYASSNQVSSNIQMPNNNYSYPSATENLTNNISTGVNQAISTLSTNPATNPNIQNPQTPDLRQLLTSNVPYYENRTNPSLPSYANQPMAASQSYFNNIPTSDVPNNNCTLMVPYSQNPSISSRNIGNNLNEPVSRKTSRKTNQSSTSSAPQNSNTQNNFTQQNYIHQQAGYRYALSSYLNSQQPLFYHNRQPPSYYQNRQPPSYDVATYNRYNRYQYPYSSDIRYNYPPQYYYQPAPQYIYPQYNTSGNLTSVYNKHPGTGYKEKSTKHVSNKTKGMSKECNSNVRPAGSSTQNTVDPSSLQRNLSRDSGYTSPTETVPKPCENCSGPGAYICSGCQSVFYCSRKCQEQAWSIHLTKCGDST